MFNIADQEANRFSVKDRVIVLTGCSGILGSAYSRALGQRGARLVLSDLPDRDPVSCAAKLRQEFQVEAFGVPCDVGCERDVVNLFNSALERFGRVDAVVNNAAATGEHLMRAGDVFAVFEEYPLNVWEQVLRVNLTGVFLVAREGGKAMLQNGGGSLINVSSIYGISAPDHNIYEGMPFSSFPSYSAGKAGVHGLTLWLSTYWARKGIRVNTLVPGGVFNQQNEEFVRRYAARTPMGRMANSDDLIGMVVFLVSNASCYCTGQKFVVDGGLTSW